MFILLVVMNLEIYIGTPVFMLTQVSFLISSAKLASRASGYFYNGVPVLTLNPESDLLYFIIAVSMLMQSIKSRLFAP